MLDSQRTLAWISINSFRLVPIWDRPFQAWIRLRLKSLKPSSVPVATDSPRSGRPSRTRDGLLTGRFTEYILVTALRYNDTGKGYTRGI